jgi:HEAT repeat protein
MISAECGLENRKIVIDLKRFQIKVVFPQPQKPLTVLFDSPSRKFYFSVIALVAREMKKRGELSYINIRSYQNKLRILDRGFLGPEASKDNILRLDKVRKAWRNKLPNLEKASLFTVLNRSKIEPYYQNWKEYKCNENEIDMWFNLFDYNKGKQKKWLWKLAVDRAKMTLDDLKIIYEDSEGECAWTIFLKNLESKIKPDIEDKIEKKECRIEHGSNIEDNVLKFLLDLEDELKTIKLLHSPNKIILKDQYIPIHVTRERIYKHDIERFGRYTESEEEIKRVYALRGRDNEYIYPVPWEEAKKQADKIIVIGDPGMGKSTLLKMEAVEIAQHEIQKIGKDKFSVDDTFFPIFLRLYDLSKSGEEVIDTIPELIKRDYPKTSETIEPLLKQKLKTGKCILLLDALDEVPKENRILLSEKINRFVRNYPTRIISTSRIVGYGGGFMHSAKEFEILPFNQDQIESFIKTWFNNAAESIEDKLASPYGLLYELKKKPQIRGLSQNPLLLSFLCSLYQEQNLELPTRRCKVYEKAISYMLSKWSQKRTYQTEARIQAKLNILEELAYYFSCRHQEIFSIKELLKWFQKYIQDGKFLDTHTNSDLLITELSEDDGIILKLEREGSRYIFLHRTFQEYLTASFLANSFDLDQDAGIKLIREYYWNFDWHETIALTAGLLKNPVSLINDIKGQNDDIFRTLLILAGNCVAECEDIYSTLIDEVAIKELFNMWHETSSEKYLFSMLVSLGFTNAQVRIMFSEVLRGDDSFLKREAVRALGEIGNTDNIFELIEALRDKKRFVRRAVAEALEKTRDENIVCALIQMLSDEDSLARMGAAEALGKICSIDSVPALIKALGDEDESVKEMSAEALGEIGNIDSITALQQALSDKDTCVRESAAEALGKICSTDSVPVLIDALNDKNIRVVQTAARALKNIGYDEIVPKLEKDLINKDKSVRLRATKAFGQIADTANIRELMKMLSDKDKEVRCAALEALSFIGIGESVMDLIKVLGDKDPEVRRGAIKAIGKIDNIEYIFALKQALKDKNSFVRESASFALGKIGSDKSIPELIRAFSDNDRSVRCRVAEALGEIGNNDSVPELINGLRDPESTVRWKTAEALGKIGSKESIPDLIKALNDEENYVIKMAANALEKIGTLEILQKLISLPEIDIYNPKIFRLVRSLAIRHCRENVDFIPVYPKAIKKYRSIL